MSILTLVLAGVLSSHLFGVRLLEITKAKLGASGEARKALGNLSSEIRSAKWIKIGTGNASSFTEIADGLAQQGSAVQIYASMITNSFVRYYLETNGQRLMRVTSAGGSSSLVANCITNSQVFTSEDPNAFGVADGLPIPNRPACRSLGAGRRYSRLKICATPKKT